MTGSNPDFRDITLQSSMRCHKHLKTENLIYEYNYLPERHPFN